VNFYLTFDNQTHDIRVCHVHEAANYKL